jgi:CO/xanthine dehydrogenase Mo-binding subunit
MRRGRLLVGFGMATAFYGYVQAPCQARATLGRDGVAVVRSAATDIGPGTHTVITQVAADALGLPLDRVRFELGDSAMPPAPLQGGSGLTAALSSAVHAACQELLRSFGELADGAPVTAETYTAILDDHDLAELSADGDSKRRTDLDAEPGIFAAKFAEVEVDPDLGLVRVTRVVAAVDGGRVINPKTAASQIIGGTTGGIGMALLEHTLSDPGTGRIANATFGDYLVAVNADVPDVDVIFTGDPDPMNPVGVKGIGEVAVVGVAPAIANAVYHATGRRIRSLPIAPEQLL